MAFRAGILTVSDKGSIGARVDTSGPALAALIAPLGIEIAASEIVPDERAQIVARLRSWSDEARLDLILTTGGTGLAPRDVTPEATLDVAERLVPGFPEVMRASGRQSTHLSSMSRAVAVIRGRTLIINLPGSERGARESLESVIDLLTHALDSLRGDVGDEHPVDRV